MYDVKMEMKEMGGALGGEVSEAIVKKLAEIARTIPGFTDVQEYGPGGGSEDYSYFMSRVQELGGQATYVMFGTELAAGHHNGYFDINEDMLPLGVQLLAEAAYQFTTTLEPTR